MPRQSSGSLRSLTEHLFGDGAMSLSSKTYSVARREQDSHRRACGCLPEKWFG